MKTRISCNWGTHLLPLISCMEKTSGDVLEMGAGVFSTPYLHYKCLLDNRRLITYDNDPEWLKTFSSTYSHTKHEFHCVENWDDAKIDFPWDVVLIDHSPGPRRKEDVKRISKLARYIILHDTNGKLDKEYGYPEIYRMFRHKKVWDGDRNNTTVLSNFISLEDLW